MQTLKEDNLIFIRLFPNDDIHEKLKEACKFHKLKAAIVISGLGQLKEFSLGYFKEKGDYTPMFFEQPHELLGLTGNICKQNDDYLLHLHALLGDINKKVVGGHLISGKIEVTGEIALLASNLDITRKLDKATGLNLLSFR